jgi:hypothetical protein
MASLALRNLVADTNFMALVICWVLMVDDIRARISF